MVILGIDASSTVCGIAFNDSGKIICADFFDLSDLKTRREKSLFVIDELKKNPLLKKVHKINLEAPMGFGPNAKTVNILNKWNAVLEFVLEDRLNISVNPVVAVTARKKLFGVGRIKGIDSKVFVEEQLSKITPYITKFYKKNTKGNPDKRNEDIRDAIVMALFG